MFTQLMSRLTGQTDSYQTGQNGAADVMVQNDANSPVPVSLVGGASLNATNLALEAGGNLEAVLAKLPADAATSALQTAANVSLANLAMVAGNTTDAPAANDVGDASSASLFKRLLTRITGLFDNATALGTLALQNDTVTLPIGTKSTIGIQLLSGAGGTIIFQASQDGGTTYHPIAAYQEGVGTPPSSTATGNGNYLVIGGGYDHLQVCVTAAPTTPYAVSLIGTNAIKHVGVPALGGQSDPVATSGSSSASLISLVKGMYNNLVSGVFAVTNLSYQLPPALGPNVSEFSLSLVFANDCSLPPGTNNIGKVSLAGGGTAIVAGQVALTNAGQSQVIVNVSTPLVVGVQLKAAASNKGILTLGITGVTNAADGTGTGFILAPGEHVMWSGSDLSALRWNGKNAGDVLTYFGN